MAATNADEMEQFQRLSDQYQPELPGPLVGNKESISELMLEYARADPQFVTKTSALSRTHSAYRKVKGDGQCGWRGAIYGYFEIILVAGDIGFAAQEEVRIRSFEDTMRMVGIDYDLMEDMFEPTWDLFASIRKAIEAQERPDDTILDYFNDENRSNSIVYHFKMMTSAYMQLNPAEYEPFLEMSVEDYRISRIDPTNQEIDQIGLQVLTTGVISPAKIALDVLYLDRSVGDEVIPYEFVPNSAGWPTIRLLYRPGHYDLIYKDGQPIRVFLQSVESDVKHMNEIQMENHDPYIYSYLFPGSVMQEDLSGLPQSIQQSAYTTHPYNHAFNLPGHSYNEQAYQQQAFLGKQTAPSVQQPFPLPISHSSKMEYSNSRATSTSASPVTPQEPQIRFNPNVYEIILQRHNLLPLDSTMSGSDSNSQAHFRHSKFQPQVWNAKDEYGR